MARCEMGYELQNDLVPPQRCHCYDGDFGSYESCKDCHNYDEESEIGEYQLRFRNVPYVLSMRKEGINE